MPQPILVTGAHRSGTTWIGNIISSAQNVFYVQEPFNIGIKRKNSPCFYWFEHVEGKSHDEKIKFEKYLKSFYRLDREFLFEHLSEINTFKTFINFLKEYKKEVLTGLYLRILLQLCQQNGFIKTSIVL